MFCSLWFHWSRQSPGAHNIGHIGPHGLSGPLVPLAHIGRRIHGVLKVAVLAGVCLRVQASGCAQADTSKWARLQKQERVRAGAGARARARGRGHAGAGTRARTDVRDRAVAGKRARANGARSYALDRSSVIRKRETSAAILFQSKQEGGGTVGGTLHLTVPPHPHPHATVEPG